MRAAIITSSDSGYAGKREDVSGPVIAEMVREAGYEVVWQKVLPDEQAMLEEAMKEICDEGKADLLLTTGGTGFSPRDVMPEATLAVAERMVPGIPEAMRAYSLQFTKRTMLSRAASGIRKRTLIVNLPGSPKAVQECLEYILPQLDHGLKILLRCSFFRYPDTFSSGVTSTVSSTASCRTDDFRIFSICSRFPFPDFESSFPAFFRSRSGTNSSLFSGRPRLL